MNFAFEGQSKLKPRLKAETLPTAEELSLDPVVFEQKRQAQQLLQKEQAQKEKIEKTIEIENLRKQLGSDEAKQETNEDLKYFKEAQVESAVNKHLEEAVYKTMYDAPALSTPNETPAPFKNFAANDKNAWAYVPSQEIEDYLKDRFFFNTYNIEYEDMTELFEVNKRRNEEPIKIPLNLVVYAASFEDWRGRDRNTGKSWQSEYGYGTTNSLEVIKHYAGLPSELPPVGIMRMFVQPNNKIFFDNGAGDSHRIAAAMLRGDEFIKAENVQVYRLSKNYL